MTKPVSTLTLLSEAVGRPWRWLLGTLYFLIGIALTFRSEFLSPQYQQYTLIWLVSQLSWQTWLIIVLLITLIIVVFGYHRAHTKIINQITANHQTEIAQIDKLKEQIVLLQACLKEKDVLLIDRKDRKYIREELGQMLTEGEKLKWRAGVNWLEHSKPYLLWQENVKQFLNEQLDKSYVARFEVGLTSALNDFIKELSD